MYTNNLTNILSIINLCNSLVFRVFCGVFFPQFIDSQLLFCAIINIMKTLKPAPVVGFALYNGLRTTALSKINLLITSVTQFTLLPKSGTIKVQNFLSLASPTGLLKNLKVFPRTSVRNDFLPENVRLETSLFGILEARGGCNGLLLSFFLRPHVIKTPVRYNGGQVYKTRPLLPLNPRYL